MECLDMSGYFQRLERLLDCPKPLRRSFLNHTRHMAEDFVQCNPNATSQDVTDYLGDPQELAQGFLETLEPEILERYKKRKKLLLYGCVAALFVALVGVTVWGIHLKHTPKTVEVTETLIIYPES